MAAAWLCWSSASSSCGPYLGRAPVNATTVLGDIDRSPDGRIDNSQRHMAGFAMTQFGVNQGRLKFLYGLFSVALVCLGVDFAGWIWALVEH